MSTPKFHRCSQGPSFALFTYRFLSNTLFLTSFPIPHLHKKLLEKGDLFLSKCVCRTYIFGFSACIFNSHKWRCFIYPILFLLYSCPTMVFRVIYVARPISFNCCTDICKCVFAYSPRDDSQIGSHDLLPQKRMLSMNIFLHTPLWSFPWHTVGANGRSRRAGSLQSVHFLTGSRTQAMQFRNTEIRV